MPPKKADIFSKDIEFMLIDLVESKPILWDCSCELYKRADLKDSIWEEVAHSLGPHFSDKYFMYQYKKKIGKLFLLIASTIVASRFKSMRDTFMSNLRRVKDSKCSGKGTADIYIPKWYLYDRLTFLQKTAMQSISTLNLIISLEKLDDSMSQIEQISNESLTQLLEENQNKEVIVEEPLVLNIYYNDSMKLWNLLQKFMFRSIEESSDNSTDLSVSSGSFANTATTSQNASISTVSTKPAFTSSTSKIQDVENKMYTKRGSVKRKCNEKDLIEEAVSTIKTLCQPDSLHSNSSDSYFTDSAHTLGLFIAARLREMTPDQRRLSENEILKLLSQF